MSPGQAVLVGFAATILLGTALLMLPAAHHGPGRAGFVQALFTATSASSVTGLTVVDTGSYWSGFGQVIILLLIQVGGFGILSAGALLVLATGGRIGLRTRMLAQTESNALTLQDLRRVLARIAVVTFGVELLITFALFGRLLFGHDYAFGDAAWFGLFHGVSAFYGAGFSLWEDSLIRFAEDAAIIVPVGVGVIIGGLGFPVLLELWRNHRRPSRWSLHTKLTLAGTVLLLLGGMVVFAVIEWENGATLGALDLHGKIISSWFQSLTTRSAGFNTIDIGEMREESWVVANMLMFIGGGSGSTAGGIKVVTFIVLVLIVITEARGGRQAEAFGRTIPSATLRQALSVTFIAGNTVAVATLTLMALTPFSFEQCLFEVISAFSIVGLSTGITPSLPESAQLLLTGLMYVGRVGPLTLVLALALREHQRMYDYPEEAPIIG